MRQVSDTELEALVLAFMARIEASAFVECYDYFYMLYRFGMRAMELESIQEWEIMPDGNILAKTLKRNVSRILNRDDVPNAVLRTIGGEANYVMRFGYEYYSEVLRQGLQEQKIWIGGKRVKLHIFRHAYVKRLYHGGASTAAIQALMGLKSSSVVLGYLDSAAYIK